ncbi:MAG TPA: sensor histidine kinase [Acetobacteraceae bacterium]|nr:sensor histidine kinase [Acetobacteraceae bacterium]
MDEFAKLIGNPLLVVDAGGRVVEASARARRVFGARCAFPDATELRTALERASGSGQPVLAALHIAGEDGVAQRYRVDVLQLRTAAPPAFAIMVRDVEDDQFATLTRRLGELNAELENRERMQARLEETLANNRLLYRELQHRVKNHLQMITAMVSAARREAEDPAQRHFAAILQSKLSALFEAQRLMYLGAGEQGVPLDELLRSIAAGMDALAGARVAVEVDASRVLVSNDIAFPVALMANELLTNALRYASSGGNPVVLMSLRRDGAEAVLTVADDGPSFQAGASTSPVSGLGLVRGLCRQIGGHLEVQSGEAGTTVTIRFPVREQARVAA